MKDQVKTLFTEVLIIPLVTKPKDSAYFAKFLLTGSNRQVAIILTQFVLDKEVKNSFRNIKSVFIS